MNNITTIQIRENVKNLLERLKVKPNQTYEEIIVDLIDERQNNKMEQEKLLIEGCHVMAKDSLRIVKEWESSSLDWEWNEN
ncbi:MAG: hypothetical protein WCK29_01665 [archaeon]